MKHNMDYFGIMSDEIDNMYCFAIANDEIDIMDYLINFVILL